MSLKKGNYECHLNQVVALLDNNVIGQLTYINNDYNIVQLSPFTGQKNEKEKIIIDNPTFFRILSINTTQTAQTTIITNPQNTGYNFEAQEITLGQHITVRLTSFNKDQTSITTQATAQVKWISPEGLWIQCSPIKKECQESNQKYHTSNFFCKANTNVIIAVH